MFIAHRDRGCRLNCIACTLWAAMLTLVAMSGVVGCGPSAGRLEPGYADQSRTQLQFYSPPGATVTVQGHPTRSHQVATYGPYGNRLEQEPEEFNVFNLKPGRYEFKYTSAEGLPGVSIYGELNVESANSQAAQIFQRRSFIPIALPSEYYRKVEVVGNETLPYRGESFRTAIDEQDLQRLQQGDVIEKVFFIADLEEAEKRQKETQVKVAAKEREIEYADARFRYAYLDYRFDVSDPVANFWGTDRDFIKWEKKRQKLEQELDSLQAKLRRARALLKGDRVLIRKGMLVLATEEVVRPHRDVVESSDKLGEVVLVMRIGGRHMHWGQPEQELVVHELP